MARFIFSAFSDEIDSDFDVQLESLKKLNIDMIEIRGVDGKNFSVLDDLEVSIVRDKLDAANITVPALGSPIGKIDVDGDFEEHKRLFNRILDIGDALDCKRIRMFSFYPSDSDPTLFKGTKGFEDRVFQMIGELLDISEPRGFILCHENEKSIYGESPEEVLRLVENFNGRLKIVLDPANFTFCGLDASPAYPLLKEYIEYIHIKDAESEGLIVPPGLGKAGIRELLQSVHEDFPDREIIITMEPHLMAFTGLSALAKVDDIKHKYSFDSPFHAFKTATDNVMAMVEELA